MLNQCEKPILAAYVSPMINISVDLKDNSVFLSIKTYFKLKLNGSAIHIINRTLKLNTF